jgi:DNA-binding CsgD family transcriptional regulator
MVKKLTPAPPKLNPVEVTELEDGICQHCPGKARMDASESRSAKSQSSVTQPQVVAADPVAQGETEVQVARQLGVTDRTVRRWKKKTAFQRRVEEWRRRYRETIEREGITDRQRRIAELNEQRLRSIEVMAERGVRADVFGVPGGTTGLLYQGSVSVEKKRYRTYRLDMKLLQTLRRLETQAAKLLRQSGKPVPTAPGITGNTQVLRDRKREQAALWMAQQEMSDRQIARCLGVDRHTLTAWKRQLSFRARIAAHVALWAQHCRAYGIASQVARYNDIHDRLHQLQHIQYARAEACRRKRVLGRTRAGLPVFFQWIQIGHGATHIATFVEDPSLVAEVKAHRMQADQEVEAWE